VTLEQSAEARPVFSVVVPTYLRPAHLARCLQALADLDYPKGAYEIIIVDDAASPDTAALVQQVAQRHAVATSYLSQRRSGPARARNAGARAAAGQYLAFTDDDCQPAPGWLRAFQQVLDADPAALVGGRTINAVTGSVCSIASQLLIDYLYDYYRADATGARFFTTNNVAIRADRFHTLGGFDEGFPLAAAEDREFCERAQHHGATFAYAEAAVIHHWHQLTVRGFVRQHFNYGRGADFLHRSRARHSAEAGATARPKLERPRFYLRLVGYPLTRVPGWRGVSLAGLLGLSQAAYATGFAYQRLRSARELDRRPS
jgi:GT2 family glycosyltransferase